MVEQIIFSILFLLSFGFAVKNVRTIYRNIKLGKEWTPVSTFSERWKNVVIIALGQKKMFKKWLPAIFHLFIYVSFIS